MAVQIRNSGNRLRFGKRATDEFSFGGVDPVAQRAGAAGAAVSAVAITAAAGANPTQAEYATVVARCNALTTLTNELRATLVALGLHKGAA